MSDPDSRKFDVIVVGVGSIGSATCHHLAKKGAKVIGIEQFAIPHGHGSHHGNSRMIRMAYYEHSNYVPLLKRAYTLWDELQEHTSEKFFHITGGLYMGASYGSIFPGSLRAAHEHQLKHTVLTPSQISARYPALHVADHFSGFHEEHAGFLIPEFAVSAYTKSALRQGAHIVQGEKLITWNSGPDGIKVTTEKGHYWAKHLVITAGAWSMKLARELGCQLKVTRQVMAWFKPLGSLERFAPGNFPCWFIETESPFGHYGFPVIAGDPGLKVALHKPGEVINPEHLQDEYCQPQPEEIDQLRTILDEYFPGCAGRLTRASICMYTNSPDGHFIVGHHPYHSHVSIACGLSGHGFKFSSVLGEVLADLALEGKTSMPVNFLSPQRYLDVR